MKPVEKTGKRKVQAEETKAKIYRTAQELIKKHGYEGAAVEKICRLAGVSKGAFYHHFPSKADLIVEGYSLCDRYFEDHVAGELKALGAEDKLVEFIQYQLEYAVETGIDLIKQVYKSQIDHGTSFFISQDRTLPTLLNQIVKEGQNNGALSTEVSADYISQFLLRFSRGLIYDWCLHDGAYDLLALGEEAARRTAALFRADAAPQK